MIVGKLPPLSDRHLFTKRLGVGGIKAIFGVHALGVRAEDVDGVGGVPLAVEDQVGDVEVDADVVEATSRMARTRVIGVSWPVSQLNF